MQNDHIPIDEHDWLEHLGHEQGEHTAICSTCLAQFVGRKDVGECKKCYIERIEGELACACQMLDGSVMTICVTCGNTERPCCDNECIRPVTQMHAHMLLRDARKDVMILENFTGGLQSIHSDDDLRELICDLSKELKSAHKRVEQAKRGVE